MRWELPKIGGSFEFCGKAGCNFQVESSKWQQVHNWYSVIKYMQLKIVSVGAKCSKPSIVVGSFILRFTWNCYHVEPFVCSESITPAWQLLGFLFAVCITVQYVLNAVFVVTVRTAITITLQQSQFGVITWFLQRLASIRIQFAADRKQLVKSLYPTRL